MKDSEARKHIGSIYSILNNKVNDKILLRRTKIKDNTFVTVSGSPFGYPIPEATTIEVSVVELLQSILDYLDLDIVPKDTRKTFTLVKRDKE